MISITFTQMQEFNQNPNLINKLVNTPMESKLSYDIKKILDTMGLAYKAQADKFAKARTELQRKHCVVDGNGEMLIEVKKDENGKEKREYVVIEGHHDDLDKEMTVLFAANTSVVFAVARDPIHIDRLLNAKNLSLSVAEITQLEPLIYDPADHVVAPAENPSENVTPIRPSTVKEAQGEAHV